MTDKLVPTSYLRQLAKGKARYRVYFHKDGDTGSFPALAGSKPDAVTLAMKTLGLRREQVDHVEKFTSGSINHPSNRTESLSVGSLKA